MSYQLFDQKGNSVTYHDLQDKGIWCRSGASKEEVFVDLYGQQLNLIINPEKLQNPYVPDLLNTKTQLLGDLKTQNTPFFQAKSRFGLDPQYSVVFNGKDRERYKRKYSNIEIYFMVDWQIIRFKGWKNITVQPMVGIWFIPFEKLNELCKTAPFHSYYQRQNDRKGNAKGSYILDLRNDVFQKLV